MNSLLKRHIFLPLVLTGLILLVFVLGLFVGSVQIPVEKIWAALVGETSRYETIVIWQLRLPRLLNGVVAGACLGLSGLIMQTILRNPLASPELTGVSMGAALFVVATIVFFPAVGAVWHPFLGMIGGCLAGGLVLGVALSRDAGTLGLILGGVAVSSLCGAGVMVILNGFAPFSQPAYVWLIGALAGRGFMHLQILLPGAVGGVVLLIIARRPMLLLSLGDDAAKAAGVNVSLWRTMLLLAALTMTASVVAIAGPVAFVGLVAPHLARFILKSPKGLILSSALMGGLLMIFCDWLARVVAIPREIPVGLFLALVGAPVFIWLIRRAETLDTPQQGTLQ